MKLRHWIFCIGFLRPDSVLGQYTEIVRIDTGTCAPSYSGGASTASAGAGGGGIASDSGNPNSLSLAFSATTSGVGVIPSASVTASSVSPASSAFSPPAPGDGFLITISPSSRLRPRQGQAGSPGYVGPNGQPTDDCYSSTIYTLSSNGTLCTSNRGCFSTSPGIDFQPFVPSTSLQSISTTWEFSNGNNLVWSNDAFLVDPAIICRNFDSDTIEVYFQITPPATCTPLGLSSAPLSQCPGIESSLAATVPSSTRLSVSSTGSGLSSGGRPSSSPPISDSLSSIPVDSSTPMSITGISSEVAPTGFPSSADSFSMPDKLSASSTIAGGSSEAVPTSLPSGTDFFSISDEGTMSSTIADISSAAAATTSAPSTESALSASENISNGLPSSSEAAPSGSLTLPSSGSAGSLSYSSAFSSNPASSQSSTPSADGLAYHGYIGPVYNGNNDVAQYNANPDFNVGGIAQSINFASSFSGDIVFPGQQQAINVASPAYAVVYQGYFLAPDSASYTLSTTKATDDFGYIWYGDKAKSQWSDANADATSQYNDHDGSVTFQLSKGEEIPVTIVWVNAANAGGLNITVYSSATGETLSDTTGFFVSPQASDGFSNGVGTPYYSASGSSSTGAASSATVAASSSGTSGATASSSGASGATASSSGASGATASSSGATTSSTGAPGTAKGLVYGVFANPSYDATNKADSVAYFNSINRPLINCGISEVLNFFPSANAALPGQTGTSDLSNIAVVYHGYFIPPQTGEYYIAGSSVTFSYLWTGDKAYTGWTSSNPDADDNSAQPLQLTEGVKLPITLLYVNKNSNNAQAYFNVRYPDLTYHEDLSGLLSAPEEGEIWSPLPVSECVVPTSCDSNGFYQYYFGSGHVFSAGAPANYDSNPHTLPYPASTSEAHILNDCGANATSIGYQHLDIHFDRVDNQWYCVQYHGYSNDTQYWSDATDRVTQAFGYSHC